MQANDLLALVVSCGIAGVLDAADKNLQVDRHRRDADRATDHLTSDISPNNSITQIFCCG
ncbi:hypothetical protein ABQZ99_000190 [Xanthomonas hortorum pv. vitians]|uniref:Uncharacterized protein n=1 Tax=Xanthomonas hortorum pv. vitians TaxID=83224 RepID=A0A6V7BWE9_9XANT|nr:hypothetical protein [Xanthomonas hortorum]MCC4623767.1 hypothetical protein [Xanthomonas campestris pv. nigromaculans]MCC8495668.1 hypothetical protein [Xanthomonas hortorum pv. gardneri]MCC8500282.1 hypothetical protein [Xanthomonas hortorum pv. gardneri]MCC8508778.1 hypothetical protein [Xanthomonas hortorum pv. gardneri]MCC8510476.1 hypothetical protein [Xanthomonas hortorum pv. gardneri]